MFVEVGSLGKAEVAVRVRACVGSFIRMNSQMIEKVMPLPKMFTAVVMVTFQHFYVSFRFRILESKDSEFLGCWYVFFDLNRSQIERVTCLY